MAFYSLYTAGDCFGHYLYANEKTVLLWQGFVTFKETVNDPLLVKLRPLDPSLLAFEYQYPIFTVMSEYLLLKLDEKDTSKLEAKVEQRIHYLIEKVKL